MYPAGAAGAQAAPQGPSGPTASPAYSSYQPTPTQGYQVGGRGSSPPQPGPWTFSHHTLPSTERGLPGPAEPSGHLPAPAVRRHGLHGEPVGVHGLPALQHAGETVASRWRRGWGSTGRARARPAPCPAPPPALLLTAPSPLLGSPRWWSFDFSKSEMPPFLACRTP